MGADKVEISLRFVEGERTMDYAREIVADKVDRHIQIFVRRENRERQLIDLRFAAGRYYQKIVVRSKDDTSVIGIHV